MRLATYLDDWLQDLGFEIKSRLSPAQDLVFLAFWL